MPGHSLIQINGVYKIYVGLEIANILQKLPPLLDKFFDFAANHPQQNQLRPRDWIAASSGGRDGHHHKTIVSHLAAILESLQRYAVPNARQANSPPAPSYQPGQGWGSTDHDLIVQLLKDLWTELTNKPNPGGGFSAAPGFPAGPPMAGGAYTQPGYDQWVAQMVLGFHQELTNKPDVNQTGQVLVMPTAKYLKFVGAVLDDMIDMLS